MRFAATPANAATVPTASGPRDEKTPSFGPLIRQACAGAYSPSEPERTHAARCIPWLGFFCDHPVPVWSHDDAVPGVCPARRGFPDRDVDPVALCAAVSAAAGAATTGATPALAATALAATAL